MMIVVATNNDKIVMEHVGKQHPGDMLIFGATESPHNIEVRMSRTEWKGFGSPHRIVVNIESNEGEDSGNTGEE